MPDRTTETSRTPLSGNPMQDMADMQSTAIQSLTGMNTAWFETLSDMGSEVMSFVADRIKEDVKTQHALLHCKDPGELQHIQGQFIQKALDQYADETGKLIEMSRKMFDTAGTADKAGR